jgi:hypothetical protein
VYDVTTEAVLAWIKTLSTKPEHYYCGMLNDKKEKSFGIFIVKLLFEGLIHPYHCVDTASNKAENRSGN